MKKNIKLSLTLAMVFVTIFSFNLPAFCRDFDSNDSYDQYLIKSLEDKNIGIRTSAATLLGKRKVTEAIDPLIKMLKNEKQYSARIIAALALYKIGDERIVPVLEERIKNDRNKTVQHVLTGIVLEMVSAQLGL